MKKNTKLVPGMLSLTLIGLNLPMSTPVIFANSEVEVSQVVAMAKEVTSASSLILDASKIGAGTLKSDLKVNGMTVKANSGKTVVIDASAKTSEYNHEFANRIKLGGAGAADYRSIEFTTNGPAKVTIYALSSSSDDRQLGIYNVNNTKEPVEKVTANGTVTDKEGKLPQVTVDLTEAGTYYMTGVEKAVNIYYVQVDEGEVEPITFTDGQAPKVEKVKVNEENSAKLDVTVSGTIAKADTDRIVVKLLDEEGTFIASNKITSVEDGQATVSLTPPASGNYQIIAEAVRAGVKEGKVSEAYVTNDFKMPLPEVAIKSVTTGENHSLDVAWGEVAEAETYSVAYKKKAESDEAYKEVAKGLTSTSYNIPNLEVGETYTVKVTAYRGEETTQATEDKKVAAMVERFVGAKVGSGAAGDIIQNEDGSVTLNATGGKLADSEDGFLYYYTQINPKTENFTLKATFVVDNADNKDNQSGFGVMAIDTLVADDGAARYFNSAGSMVRKYSQTENGSIVSHNGIPGGLFVTGYTEGPTVSSANRTFIDTAPFDWNYKADYVTETNSNPPKFETGEEYTLILRKSNTGFHASMVKSDGTLYDDVICYEPELLLQQDKDKYYVGVCASRKIQVTVKDMSFTTIRPEDDEAAIERPKTTVAPSFNLNSSQKTSQKNYEVGFKSNFIGTVSIEDASGKTVASNLKVDPTNEVDIRALATLSLKSGDNEFKAIYTPATKEEQGSLLAQSEDLTSYDPITLPFTITCNQYGTEKNAIYVSPTGKEGNKGTKASPLDVQTAVSYAQPGQQIVLLSGTYQLTSGITIERGNNGTEEKPIVLMSEPNERAVLDLSNCSSTGLSIAGDYWHIYNLEIKNSQGGKKPVWVGGNHNIVEKVTTHDNADTGLQISGTSTEPKAMWPSYNLILSCEAYNNCDPQANDADGFAAKLTCGEGNVFRYCISHHNIDDGWDLYAKSTTGVIGEVTIDQCVAYENGKLTADKDTGIIGEGNGFKLGGESMPVAHVLKNSISYNNLANGVFSNSNPSCQIYNTTSYANDGCNLQLNTNATATTWKLDGLVSYKGGKADTMSLKGQESLLSETNYVDGSNTAGVKVQDSWFASLDTSLIPTIAEDGSIDMHGLLMLTKDALEGGVISTNPNPTQITIGAEITTGSTDDSTGGSTGGSSSSSSSGGGKIHKNHVTVESSSVVPSVEPSTEPTTNQSVKMKLQIGKKQYTVNGKTETSEVVPELINGRTMVPIRFIAESFGATVNWDATAKQVTIVQDGKTIVLTAKEGVIIKNDRTLVPLRVVSESLGAKVNWISATKEIEIEK